jgi:hypothetical protein
MQRNALAKMEDNIKVDITEIWWGLQVGSTVYYGPLVITCERDNAPSYSVSDG